MNERAAAPTSEATNSTSPTKSAPQGRSECGECERLKSVNTELLAVCREALEMCRDHHHNYHYYTRKDLMAGKLRAAIKLAEPC